MITGLLAGGTVRHFGLFDATQSGIATLSIFRGDLGCPSNAQISIKSVLPAGAAALLAATVLFADGPAARAQTGCSGDDGGITLSPGFCATVFGDNLGHVRHLVVAGNGVVFANSWSGRYYHNDTPHEGGFVVALQDTKGTGQADKIELFSPTFAQGNHGGTGIALYKNYVYVETNDRIVRYALPKDGSVPTGPAETVVSGLPLTGDHPMHPIMIDARGNMYLDEGSATNFLPEPEPHADRAWQTIRARSCKPGAAHGCTTRMC